LFIFTREQYTLSDEYITETLVQRTGFGDSVKLFDKSSTFYPMPNPKKIKTRLPAARIKRIMRTDEDVGKVSQATPVLIAKALECFLEALVKKSLVETVEKQAKKLTIAHV
jgi:histone H3/H4